MAKINPREHADTYKKQEQMSSFAVPPSGTYLMVNTKIIKQAVGQNESIRYRFKATVLGHVESDGNEGAQFIGKTLSLDLWGNFEKNFNVERMSHLGIACGQTEAWDPEDPKELTKATTGVPYQLKMKRTESEYQGKTFQNVDVVEFKAIGADAKAKFTKAPDWSKTVGPEGERFVDESKDPPKSNGKNKMGGKATPAKESTVQADPFKDDDINF